MAAVLFLRTTNAVDDDISTRLSSTLGHSVTERILSSAYASSESVGDDLVVCSAAGSSGNSTDLVNTNVPVISLEAYNWDDMNMITTPANGVSNAMTIIDASNPIAGGVGAGATTFSSNASATRFYGDAVASAQVLADTGITGQHVCFVIEEGAALTTGNALKRRVALGWGEDGYTTLSTDALAIFDASVSWALTAPATGLTISAADPARAGAVVQLTVNDSTGCTGATYDGTSLTSFSIVNGTTVQGTMPIGGRALGGSYNFTVTNASETSAGFPATYLARSGYSYVTWTAADTAFDADSPFYNGGVLVSGDQTEYELALDPSSGITVDSFDAATGLPTLSANITVDNVSSYYHWDASDTYSVGTVGTINWNETVVPTFSSAAVPTGGTTLVVTCSENMAVGAGGGNGMTVTASGGAVTLTYASVSTNTVTYNTSRTIQAGEILSNLSYTQPTNGLEDASNNGNDLASFSGQAVTNNSTADAIAPVYQSSAIAADGDSISITYGEAVTVGAGGNTGYTISASGGASTLTYSSGDGTTTLVYTLSRTIDYGETITLSYTNPGNGIEDAAGNDVANLSAESVTNGSLINAPTATKPITSTSILCLMAG